MEEMEEVDMEEAAMEEEAADIVGITEWLGATMFRLGEIIECIFKLSLFVEWMNEGRKEGRNVCRDWEWIKKHCYEDHNGSKS